MNDFPQAAASPLQIGHTHPLFASMPAQTTAVEKSSRDTSGKFSTELQLARKLAMPFHAQTQLVALRNTNVLSSNGIDRATSNVDKAILGLETTLTRNMIESMQPEDSSSLFGDGVAGSIWKSMFSDIVAEHMSRSGFTGIGGDIRSSIEGNSSFPETRSTSAGTNVMGTETQTSFPQKDLEESPISTIRDLYSSVREFFSSLFNISVRTQSRWSQLPGEGQR